MALYAPTPGLMPQLGAENETQREEGQGTALSCPQRRGGAEREDASGQEILVISAAHGAPQMGTGGLRA